MTPSRRPLLVAEAAAAAMPAGATRQSLGFLWGAATAAHQIGGNNVNSDYWMLERVVDTYLKEPSGDACDSLTRWREHPGLAEKRYKVCEAHRATRTHVRVSENGIDTLNDAQRVGHMRSSVATMATTIASGLPMLGYLHWSLLDNFEWSSGYAPRYGMVAVDRATFKRTPKPSLVAYRTLIAEQRRLHRWA